MKNDDKLHQQKPSETSIDTKVEDIITMWSQLKKEHQSMSVILRIIEDNYRSEMNEDKIYAKAIYRLLLKLAKVETCFEDKIVTLLYLNIKSRPI